MLKSWTPGEEPDKDEMKVQLEKTRNRLYDLQMKIKEHKLPVLVLFEGWSAAGKGSMIGKVIRNIDPRFFKVATMSAPMHLWMEPRFQRDTNWNTAWIRENGRIHRYLPG